MSKTYNVFILRRNDCPATCQETFRSMKWLKKYMPAYLKLALPAWLCLFCEVMIDLSIPRFTRDIVNVGIFTLDTDYVLRTGLVMLGLALLGCAAGQIRNVLSTNASQAIGTAIRADLFRKTQAMSLMSARRLGPASLITRLTNDVMQIQNMSFLLTRIFIRAPLLLIGGTIMAATMNAALSLILVGTLPLMAGLIYLRIKRGFPLFQKVQGAIDRVNAVMREYLLGVRVVKVFNRFEHEAEKFDGANRDLTGLGVRAARSMATIQPLMYVLMNGSVVLALWLGGMKISAGSMQAGDIIAFVNYFLMILQAMTMVSMIFTQGVRSKASADRIGEVFALPDDMPDPANPVSPPARGAVEMQAVSFAYPGQQHPALEDISFRIEPGQTAAIIGSTGSGKSTLVNLIPRFHDATAGRVKVDGEDVRDFTQANLRGRIAVVPQQAVLFTGTLADNLRWGKPGAADEEIERAAAIAQALEFIRARPEGWETRIGQGGVNLSGGQKQRMAIARALVRRPGVLILDDSTSAVDVETEQRIREGLRQYCGDMTVILIAQRIHSVMEADTILVMDAGRIVAQGTHRELLETSPVYRDIFRSQMGMDTSGREVV
jgi:ATP-binding cassette subfamily B multidrug efflux pump